MRIALRRRGAALTLLLLLSGIAGRLPADPLTDLLHEVGTDTLAGPLRRFENSAGRVREAAEAALLLGHLHFARGEYREAAAAFARASARLDPARKTVARFHAGLSHLGLGQTVQGRAAFEEVVRAQGPLRVEALLGVAHSWEISRSPERALETLTPLRDEQLGEAGPAVLERLATLAERAGRKEITTQARARLLQEYPRSIEAAAARLSLASAGDPGTGSAIAVIGSFVDPARARSLAREARRAGFPQAQVVVRGQGLAQLHVVRLGVYPGVAEARQAGELAAQALGVSFEVGRAE